jgi:hypothetical protein
MSETEWIACCEPDLIMDEVEGTVSREQLVEFVRRCWERITLNCLRWGANLRWSRSSQPWPANRATTTRRCTPTRPP